MTCLVFAQNLLDVLLLIESLLLVTQLRLSCRQQLQILDFRQLKLELHQTNRCVSLQILREWEIL